MTIQWIPPAPALADLVQGYMLRDMRGQPGCPAAGRINRYPALPFCCINFVLEGQLAIVPSDPSREPPGRLTALPPAYLMGANTRPFASTDIGPVHVLSIVFHTSAFACFSGLSMEWLADRVLPLGALPDTDWAALDRSLRMEATGRLEHLEYFLRQRWQSSGQDFDPAPQAAALLLGKIPVAAVAEQLGWSTRTLERRIRRGFGLAPRQLRHLLRATSVFRAARETRQLNEGGNLAHLATEYGYADQAHMSRELRAWSGVSPSKLLAGVATDESYWVYRL